MDSRDPAALRRSRGYGVTSRASLVLAAIVVVTNHLCIAKTIPTTTQPLVIKYYKSSCLRDGNLIFSALRNSSERSSELASRRSKTSCRRKGVIKEPHLTNFYKLGDSPTSLPGQRRDSFITKRPPRPCHTVLQRPFSNCPTISVGLRFVAGHGSAVWGGREMLTSILPCKD